MKKLDLEHGNINKLILRLFIPAIIGCFISSLYNIINRFFIGKLSSYNPEALTSLGIVTPISTLILAFSVLVGIGSSASISIKLGEKDNETVDKVLGNALFIIALLTALITSIGLVFMKQILYGIGATESSYPYARDYLRILLMGAGLSIFSNAFVHIIRGEGNTFYSTFVVVTGAVCNIILDPILIFQYQLGLQGAAIATIISQFIMCLLVVAFYVLHKSKLHIKLRNLLPSIQTILLILSIGIAPFIMQSSMSVVNLTVNHSLKYYGGSQAIGVMAIISSIQAFIMVPILGISQGIQPIIGFNYGAKKYDRVKKVLKAGFSLILTLIKQIIILIPLYIFLPRILGIKGVWISNPIADIVITVITIIFYIREMHVLKKT